MLSIPSLSDPIYTMRRKVRGFSVPLNVLCAPAADVGRLLRRALPAWTKADHIAAARFWLREQDRAREQWSQTRREAHLAAFLCEPTATDYKVSGIGREEYSAAYKEGLRYWAHRAGAAGNAAFAHFKASGLRRSWHAFTQEGE